MLINNGLLNMALEKIIKLCLVFAVVAGCENALSPLPEYVVLEGPDMVQTASAPVTEVVPFFATALCKDDIGFDIRFGGDIERTIHATIDQTGKTHQSIHFRAKGLLGWILPETVFDETTVNYEVQGGAEMFNIQKDAGGNNVIVIHEGLLVFESLTENSRVIAHHTIRQIPGEVSTINTWSCKLK